MKTYKQIFSFLVVSILIVPQITFAAWWNPLSWSVWNIFRRTDNQTQILEGRIKELEKKLEDKATSSVEIMNQDATSIKKQNEKTQETIKPVTSVAPQKMPIVTTPPPAAVVIVAPAPLVTSWEDLENKYFTKANQNGWTYLSINNETGEYRYYRKEGNQWVRKNTSAEAQQSLQSEPQQAQIQQSTKDLAKENELKALEDKYNNLGSQIITLETERASLPCLGFITGEMASRCKQLILDTQILINEQRYIVSKQALLEGIYLPLPIATASTQNTIQCFWSNGGAVWNCSSGSGSTQTQTECSWSIGGTTWNCR